MVFSLEAFDVGAVAVFVAVAIAISAAAAAAAVVVAVVVVLGLLLFWYRHSRPLFPVAAALAPDLLKVVAIYTAYRWWFLCIVLPDHI